MDFLLILLELESQLPLLFQNQSAKAEQGTFDTEIQDYFNIMNHLADFMIAGSIALLSISKLP